MPDQLTDPRIDAYIEKAAPFAQPILTHLRKLVHQACPRITESLKWGMPFFIQQGVILCNMAAFKRHCAFGFWGKEMQKTLGEDGRKSSQAMGTLGRITLMKDLPPDKDLLGYLRRAAELVESGQRTKSIDRSAKRKPKPVVIPPALGAALKKNRLASKAFAAFPPGKQREYADWITEAKRPETRQQRLTQAVAWIAQGKSRNWKYENC
ncbi:MAG TPA: YdeI/OmpD-associated family protein [Methylomirabilota bacterium]|nr:YdeI/OmpD-associated family protein [Methylomirabilota bacterium]